jgi:2-polyprenyl-3-methyl-5-hydroxy-6-metoxy-1,4-benzoquinol methylase
MVFANPVSAGYLDGSYYEDVGRPFYLSPAKLAGDFAEVRFRRELQYFRRFCKAGRVLDVGCSTGAFLHQLKARWPGYDVYGTDVSGPGLEHARSVGIKVLQGDFLSHQPADPYDAITFWATLEHVAQPKLLVEKAAGLLRPGGYCFILVPNIHSLATRLLGSKYRYILSQHINYFTHRTLKRLAGRSLTEVFYTSTHFNPVVIIQDFRKKQPPSDAERADLLQRTNAMKTNPWLAPMRLVYGLAERMLQAFDLADNCLLVLRK